MPEGPFVLAGLPYPKGANNPGQSNMVGDYETVWEFHRTMIDHIYEKIPNLKKEWSIISGFSNGGHSIDGMLRVRDKKGALADYFGAFVLADGGGGYASEDGAILRSRASSPTSAGARRAPMRRIPREWRRISRAGAPPPSRVKWRRRATPSPISSRRR